MCVFARSRQPFRACILHFELAKLPVALLVIHRSRDESFLEEIGELMVLNSHDLPQEIFLSTNTL